LDLRFPILFWVALPFLYTAGILQMWIMWRLSKAGVRVKWFATASHVWKLFRQYRELAPSQRWPLWPLYTSWVLTGIGFALGLASFLWPEKGIGVSFQGTHADSILLAISYLFDVIVAVTFAMRAFRNLPKTARGSREWRQVISDEYRRSDLYLALLSSLALPYIFYLSRWYPWLFPWHWHMR
jgi:hypothetical protein